MKRIYNRLKNKNNRELGIKLDMELTRKFAIELININDNFSNELLEELSRELNEELYREIHNELDDELFDRIGMYIKN